MLADKSKRPNMLFLSPKYRKNLNWHTTTPLLRLFNITFRANPRIMVKFQTDETRSGREITEEAEKLQISRANQTNIMLDNAAEMLKWFHVGVEI